MADTKPIRVAVYARVTATTGEGALFLKNEIYKFKSKRLTGERHYSFRQRAVRGFASALAPNNGWV